MELRFYTHCQLDVCPIRRKRGWVVQKRMSAWTIHTAQSRHSAVGQTLPSAECLISAHPGPEPDWQNSTRPGHSRSIRQAAIIDPKWILSGAGSNTGTCRKAVIE